MLNIWYETLCVIIYTYSTLDKRNFNLVCWNFVHLPSARESAWNLRDRRCSSELCFTNMLLGSRIYRRCKHTYIINLYTYYRPTTYIHTHIKHILDYWFYMSSKIRYSLFYSEKNVRVFMLKIIGIFLNINSPSEKSNNNIIRSI